MAFRYRLYGLTLESERALPLLWPEPDADRAADAVIRFGPVPEPDAPSGSDERDLVILPDGTGWFRTARGLRFRVPDGTTILADVPPDTTSAELHTCLFGPPMAWLMHRRGKPPLHACVVEIKGRAVALAGDSGAGKSTLARALIARGHGLVTDDQAVIDPESRMVHPGYPAIKLRSESAERFGDPMPERLRVLPGARKFHRPVLSVFVARPLALALVVVLVRDDAVSAPTLTPVPRREAAAILQRFLYRAAQGRLLDGGRAGFDWTLAVAAAVPLALLRRPVDLAALDIMCDAIEAAVAGSTPV